MEKLKLKDNIWWIGAIDHDLRVFDIIMYTEFGTTYNSYMIKGSEKVALVETVKYTFSEAYIKKVEEEIDLKDIDYIIVNHTEPDHAGTIEYLIKKGCYPTVVGSESAIRFLKEIANVPFKYKVVGHGDHLSLGDKTLEFISAPFLHWPDSMYTYVKEDKVLFTCDSFGSHYAFDEILFSKVTEETDYKSALRYYFDMIFGPFKSYVLEAIDKIEDLDFDMICTGHGPVLDENPRQIVEIYREWATDTFPEKKTVVIPYVAAYGYTKMLAEKIVEGLKAAGDIDVKLYDMVYDDQAQVLNDIYYADGVLFGSPTINGDALYPIMDILMKLSPIVHHTKLAGAFGSYGWSGEAVDHISNRIRDLRMRLVKSLKVNFKPNENQLEDAFDYGKEFGETILGTREYINFEEEEVDGDGDYSLDHTSKLWRCVICGEIFEGIKPPDICPACGATSDQFEIYEEPIIGFESAEALHVVVIGNGAAGISAVEAICERNENAKITLIDKEEYTAYYKPMLSDFIASQDGIETVFLKDMDWYNERNINFLRGKSVTQINSKENQVLLNNGDIISYDRLIIAAGANCFVPPIKQADLKGVFTLRNMDDAMEIKAYAENARKAVVVGGGLLGLETADELKKMGLDVTVVEIFERILPRQMDDKGAAILESGIERSGINLMKGATVEEIIGIDCVKGVKVSNGHTLVADIVIVSAGIRSETSLAKAAGIDCDRGIVVNGHMQTNIENIYAAGDVAEYLGIDYAIWPEAMEQGKVAGANAVGDEMIYENMIPSNIFNGMKMNVFSIGDVNIDETDEIHSMTYEDKYMLVYKRLIFKSDQLIGGVIIGDNKKSKMLIDGMRLKASSSQMKRVFQ